MDDYDPSDIMDRISRKKRETGFSADLTSSCSPKKKQFVLEYQVDESDLVYVNKPLFD